MKDLTCDVAVIGAGTAGLAAERSARKHGASTLLIDPDFAGTTCATVGCMPSKLLIAAARAADRARKTDTFGIRTGSVAVDGSAVMRRVRAERDRFARLVREGLDRLPKGTCIRARARFTDVTGLALDDGRQVRAGAVVIATGARPMIPPPFRDLGTALLTNESLFELDDLPGRVAVIGGGPIGLELAQALARLDVKVALFDQAAALGPDRCPDVQKALRDVLAAEMDLHLGTEPEPKPEGDGVRLTWEGGAATFDKVLLATGRPPSLDGLGLEATGLALDEHGLPDLDPATLQCGEAPIFMAGDANADRPVLHEASEEGAIAGRNAVAFPAVVRSDRSVPFTLTFTDPPLVQLGAGPENSAATGTADYTDQGRARVEAENVGLARLYAAAPDGRLTGADLFCPDADHMAHLLALAIEQRLTVCDLLETPLYHPMLEEGLTGALRDICADLPLSVPGDRDSGDPPGG